VLSLVGTRSAGLTRYRGRQEVQLGREVQRSVSQFFIQSGDDSEGAWQFDPSLEFRHDETFDRDLAEWRARGRTRFRRELFVLGPVIDLGAGGEWLRSSGSGSQYLLDRNVGFLTGALEHIAWTGWDWRLGYDFSARAFPDSGERDHYEHSADGRVRMPAGAGSSVQFESRVTKRTTIQLVPTSRDNFWDAQASAESQWNSIGRIGARARVEGSAIRYEIQDSTLYFDYQVYRGRVGATIEAGLVSLWFGPAVEYLEARLAPEERYREFGGFAEIELLHGGGFWSLTPSAGWRDYDDAFASFGLLSPHSSFGFAELEFLGEQSLPRGWRLQALGQGRFEAHVDDSQDAASLYFSFELRKIF
jgi:hypothetical protein